MILYKNITIIGTSHIAPESVKLVKDKIREEKPGIVAIELDKDRMISLMQQQKEKSKKKKMALISPFRIGLEGFFFMLITAYMQRKLGAKIDMMPGTEMYTAYEEGKKVKSKIFLIDQHIIKTLRRFSQEFTFKWKIKMLWELIKSPFTQKKTMKKYGITKDFDLKKVPKMEMIERWMKEIKKDFPPLYKVLIDERNKVMSKGLIKLSNDFPDEKIIAVVGAGHETGMLKYIKQYSKKKNKKKLKKNKKSKKKTSKKE